MARFSRWIISGLLALLFGLSCRLVEVPLRIAKDGDRTPSPAPTATIARVLSTGAAAAEQAPKDAELTRWGNLAPGQVTQLWTGAQGDLWLAGPGGAWCGDEATPVLETSVEQILGSDRRGRVWALLDQGRQIAYFDRGRWQTFNSKAGWEALPEGAQRSILGFGELASDGQDQVWFATGRDDLRRFESRTETWKRYTAADLGFQLPEDMQEDGSLYMPAVVVSSTGKVWVSACAAQGERLVGLGVRSQNGGAAWTALPPTTQECVYVMRVDSAGRMWLGGFDKVLRYDPSSGEWHAFPLPAGRLALVVGLNLDRDGMPWIEVIRAGGASLFGSTERYHLEKNV